MCSSISTVSLISPQQYDRTEWAREFGRYDDEIYLENHLKSTFASDEDCQFEDAEVRVLKAEALWKMFSTFVNVTHVDICWLSARHNTPDLPLFLSATSICLSGVRKKYMVNSILLHPAERLKKLELNSKLLSWLELEPPPPKLTPNQELTAYWKTNEDAHRTIPRTRRLVGPLDSLLRRCTALTSLTITTVGYGRHSPFRPDTWNDQRYASWATFLASVCNQLHQFDFREPEWNFRQWIMPVLIAAPWPQMKQLEIKGVGRSESVGHAAQVPTEAEMAEDGARFRVEDFGEQVGTSRYWIHVSKPAFPHAVRDEFRGLMPAGAELMVEKEQERDY